MLPGAEGVIFFAWHNPLPPFAVAPPSGPDQLQRTNAYWRAAVLFSHHPEPIGLAQLHRLYFNRHPEPTGCS